MTKWENGIILKIGEAYKKELFFKDEKNINLQMKNHN